MKLHKALQLRKARSKKYIRREGGPGNYTYTYRESKRRQSTEQQRSPAKSATSKKSTQLPESLQSNLRDLKPGQLKVVAKMLGVKIQSSNYNDAVEDIETKLKQWSPDMVDSYDQKIAQMAGKSAPLKKPVSTEPKVVQQFADNLLEKLDTQGDPNDDRDITEEFDAAFEKQYPGFNSAAFDWKEDDEADDWVAKHERKGYVIINHPLYAGSDTLAYLAVPTKKKKSSK